MGITTDLIGVSPKAKVLEYLFAGEGEFSVADVIKGAQIGRNLAYMIVDFYCERKVFVQSERNCKRYILNDSNEFVKSFRILQKVIFKDALANEKFEESI